MSTIEEIDAQIAVLLAKKARVQLSLLGESEAEKQRRVMKAELKTELRKHFVEYKSKIHGMIQQLKTMTYDTKACYDEFYEFLSCIHDYEVDDEARIKHRICEINNKLIEITKLFERFNEVELK